MSLALAVAVMLMPAPGTTPATPHVQDWNVKLGLHQRHAWRAVNERRAERRLERRRRAEARAAERRAARVARQAARAAPTSPPSTPRPATGAHDWQALAQCEASGDWAANTDNGFSGGIQATASTWAAYGGLAYAPAAYLASPAEQITVGEKILAGQGAGAWPNCGWHLFE